MSKLTYQEPHPISREEANAAFASHDPGRIADALVNVAFHDADWTSVTSPPVTVISQPVYDLGMESAEILIRRINGAMEAPMRLVLPTTLIERQSVSMVKRAKPRQVARKSAG